MRGAGPGPTERSFPSLNPLSTISSYPVIISYCVEPSVCLPGPSEVCFPSTYPTSFSVSIRHLPSGPGIWFYSRPPEYATLGQLALTPFCGRPAIRRVLTRCSSPESLLVHKTVFPSRAHCTLLNPTASCFQTQVPFVPRSVELGTQVPHCVVSELS